MRMFNLYGQITKVNDDERIVEGVVSTESVDSDGEIVTTKAMSNAMNAFMSLPGGGNLREMHQPKAAGKIPEMWQEGGKTMIKAKVVDDEAWKKVKEQVYTGFSIGGKVVKRIGKTIEDLMLSEISLVDRPANPEAMITLFKLQNDMAKKQEEKQEVIETNEELQEEVEETTEEAPEEVQEVETAEEPTEEVEEQPKETIVNELERAQQPEDLKKGILETVSETFAKAETVKALEEQVADLIEKVSKIVVPTAAKASYSVDRFAKSEAVDPVATLRSEYNELSKKVIDGTATTADIAKARELEYALRRN